MTTELNKQSDATSIALINNNIQYIQRDVADIKTTMKELSGTYVTTKTFNDFLLGDYANMKRIVYGAVGLILVGFFGAVINFFIAK